MRMLTYDQEREANRTPRSSEDMAASAGDEKARNQALASFFAGLVKKPGGSPRASPSI